MEPWIAANPAVVLLVFSLLSAAVVVLAGIMIRREVARVDAIEVLLRRHIDEEGEILQQLVGDVAELKTRIMPRSPTLNGEFRAMVADLHEVLKAMKAR